MVSPVSPVVPAAGAGAGASSGTPVGAGAEGPRVVGRYTIYGEIASGGMASVHFARLAGPSGFGRTVAVKRAHPHLARDNDFALMFLDEARLASRIRHSNVVSTIDVLNAPNELLLVMDYVHGESLWRLLRTASEKRERVPAPIAAAIVIDTLHGLHAAHEATDERGEPLGIVHRDVSPHNILVGVDGISRIVDFGIAKAAGRLHSTRDSAVKGKYAYMAPEQIRGEPVSRLTDTYAASIVFWELLTGERLFVGKNEAETIHRCLVARVQPPSLFAPGLPQALDEIVRRGLSREPSRRYQTAKDMARDIESCIAAVRPSEVGAWVERIARESLQERAAVIAAIEHDDFSEAEVSEEVPVGAGASQSVTWAVAPQPQGQTGSGIRASSDWTPQSAKSRVSNADRQEITRAHSRRTAVLSALFGIVLASSVAALLARRSVAHLPAPPPLADVPNVVSDVPPPAVDLAPVVATAAPKPAPSPAPPATADVAQVAAHPVATASTPSGRPTSSHTGPAHSGRAKRSACDPPYSIDSQGMQIFKPECM